MLFQAEDILDKVSRYEFLVILETLLKRADLVL
jgi:hypothetical protein